MKSLLKLFVIIFALLAYNATDSFAKGGAKSKKKTESVTYSVDIHCKSCKDKIEKNIPFEKGVKEVEVDMDNNRVKVTFNPSKNNKKDIKKSLEKLDLEVGDEVKETKEKK